MTKQTHIEKNIYRIDSLTVYEVKEEELEILKQWPNIKYSWLFDISILFFWVFISNGIIYLTWLWPIDINKMVIFICIIVFFYSDIYYYIFPLVIYQKGKYVWTNL